MSDENHDVITPAPAAAQPSLGIEPVILEMATTKQRDEDPYLVRFNPAHDSDNPKDWPSGQKWTVTDVLSATGFNRIMVSTIMAPAISTIAAELDMSAAESTMALSIYLLATAFGPLVLGPLSEVYGRSVVLHGSSVWFLVWNLACGFARNKSELIAARFFTGFGASAIYALAGGVLGDIWTPEQRGRSLGIYYLIPLLGAAVGPVIGGFIAARASWRWAFWATSAFQGVMIVGALLTFRETYGPIILKRRAERLRKETGNDRYHTADEVLGSKRSALSVLSKALSRPVRLLAFHPIIQINAVLSGLSYGLLYIVLATFASVWTDQYHESIEISGLHYIACALGEIIGAQLGGPLMDFLYRRKTARGREAKPEDRIMMTFPFQAGVPLCLFFYGWSAQRQLPWAVVDAAVVLLMGLMQAAGMPLVAYVVDVYAEHTSSAMAATQFVKSLTAFSFPLFAPYMYRSLGYGWGNSLIGFVWLFVALPAPMVLVRYGARLRAKAQSTY